MATKTVLLTSGTTWTVPADLDKSVNVTVVAIGAGGGGGRPQAAVNLAGGGGGGAFSSSSISLAGITTAYYSIGAGGIGATTNGGSGGTGGDTWFNKSTNAAPSLTSDGVLAKGAFGGTASTSGIGGVGGASASGVGTTKFSGGNGGGASAASTRGGGGGGSAADQGANGFAGGIGGTPANGGSGGGGGGGTGGAGSNSANTNAGAGGTGGLNYSGTAGTGGTAGTANGGAGGAGTNGAGGGGGGGRYLTATVAGAGGAGGAGTEYSITAGGTAGAGGGGGGGGASSATTTNSAAGAGANGGLYGGGGGGGGGANSLYFSEVSGNGGNGRQGAIIITYTVAPLATAYWVGGAGTWNASSTANWAATSGGAGGAGEVGTTTNVIFDGNSGTGTVTINAGVCNNLTIAAGVSAITLAPTTSGLSVYGNLAISSTNATISGAAPITFAATSSKTITTGGDTLDCPVTFNGVGGTWVLQDAMTVGTTRTTTLTNGTLDLNGQTLTTGIFSSTNSNTRAITSSTAATISLTRAASTTLWDTGTVTGLTGSSNVTVSAVANDAITKTIVAGALSEANAFNFTVGGTGSTITFTASNTVKNLIITNTTCTISNIAITIYGTLNIQGALPTLNAGTNAWTFAATSGTKTIYTSNEILDFPVTFNGAGGTWQFFENLTVGSTRTTTLTAGTLNINGQIISTGLFSSSNSNIRTIAFGNTGSITLTAATSVTMWDTGTVTNLSITGTPLVTTTGGGAVIKTINAGALSEANSISFTISNTAGTVAFTASNTVRNLTVTNTTCTISNINIIIYGNLNVDGTTPTLTAGTFVWTFAATSGTKTITTNGAVLDFPISFNGAGGTWQLVDNLTLGSTRTTSLGQGTLDINSKTLSTGLFSASASTSRTIAFGTGKITATSSSGSAIGLGVSVNLTITGTPIFEVTNASASGLDLGSTTPGYWTEANSLSVSIGTSSGAAGIYVTNTTSLTLAGIFKNIDFTGFTGSLAGSTRTVYGNLTIASGMTIAASASVTTIGASAAGSSVSITSNGVTVNFPITVNTGGTVSLADNLTVGATRTTTLTNGRLDLTNNTLSTGLFASSNSNIRTLAFGTGGITLTAATAVTMWDTGTVTNLTVTGTPLVTTTGGGAVTKTINSGQLPEASSISFILSDTAGTVAFTASNTVRNLTITNNAFTVSNIAITIYGNLSVGGTTVTLTAGTNAWTFAATSGTNTITTNGETLDFPVTFNGVGGTWQLVDNLTIGATRTTTLTNGTLDLTSRTLSTGLFASSNSNTRTLAFGTGGITLTAATAVTMWDTGTVTNLSITGTPLVTTTGGGAVTKTINSGQLSEANSISFTLSDTAGTVAFTASNTVRNLTISNNAFTVSNIAITIYGNLSVGGTTVTLTAGTNAWTFAATSGTKTITTNAETLDFPVTFNGAGGTWQLVDSLTVGSTRTTTLTNGTINLNGNTLNAGASFTTATGTKNLTFNAGTLTCPGTGATAFNNAAPTNFTTTAGTGTGKISMTAATAKTFVGGGSTYNCTLENAGAGALTISGNNTFTTISNSVQPTTFTFTSGSTTTVTNFSVSGTPGSLVTINSTTPGSAATLSQSSGTVSVSSCTISDSTATGGATWQALTANENTDGGGNTGWIFFTPFNVVIGNVVIAGGIILTYG